MTQTLGSYSPLPTSSNSKFDTAITDAEAERDALLRECQQMLLQISRRPSCLKLLGLAKVHLNMLAKYKLGRSRTRGSSSN